MNGAKSEKQICMESIPGEWRKLTDEGTAEFQNIMRILNRYYDAFSGGKEKTPTQKFRDEISYLSPSSLEIFVKNFGKYEYLVYCEILEDRNKNRSDTWIHVDGIAEERDALEERKYESHPVFNIVCMKGIYSGYTVESGRKGNVGLKERGVIKATPFFIK